jgi:hypothetical protein
MTTANKKFLCLCYYNEAEFKAFTPQQFAAIPEACTPHDRALRASGRCLMNASLSEPNQARVIRPSKRGPVVSNGAYAATPEPVGAAFIVEAADMDEAVRIASLHPGAQLSEFFGSGAIEVRAFDHFELREAKPA